MINWCTDCGQPFETDQKWKHLCSKCWLKQKHPELYRKKYEMAEIVCKRCKKVFVDEAWKDFCYPCWIADQEERKREDLEEREQYK